MRTGRNQKQSSWSTDSKIDRQLKQQVKRNNIFAIIVIIIIIGAMLYK